MLTRKRFMKLLILLMAISLLVAACDRPFPTPDNDNGSTQTNDNDNDSYPEPPAGSENTAVDGQADSTSEPTPEPTREVLEEEGYPAPEAEEGGTEGEEVSSEEATVAAPAEGEGEEQSEPEEEVAAESEAEVPAEATPAAEAEGEGEEQSEPEEEVAAESEAEVTAEATPAAEAEVPAEAENTVIPATHTVVAGENLYRIGLQYGISWVVIAEANNLSNPNQIYTGQVLNLSGTGGQPEPMPTPEGINYLVKPGDTLFKIAQHFGISWVEIAEANGLVNPNEIYAGQMIKIPVDAPMPPPVVHHLVKPGETLFRISLHYGVPWLAIARANKIDSPYLIYAGQTLTIPGGR